MNNKSISKNYLLNFIYQLVIIIVPIILIPFLARTLKPEGTGLYSFTHSLVIYFSMFALLGVQMYGTKMISMIDDDQVALRKVFWEIFTLKIITSLIAIVLFVLMLLFIDHKELMLIQGLLLMTNMLDITWFYTGSENFKTIVIRNTIIRLVSLALILLLIKSEADVWLYALIIAGSEFFGQLILWIDISKYKLFSDLKRILKIIEPFHHIKGMFSLFLPQAIILLYTTLNITMLGFFTTKVEVGYYDVSSRIISTLLVIVNSLGIVMLPRISKLHAQNSNDKINEILNKAVQVMSYMSYPITFGLMITARLFVPWFLGDLYSPAIILIMVLSIKIILVQYSNIVGIQYLIPTGRNKIFVISVIFAAVTNIIGNILLIPILGALGSVISTLISEFIVTLMQFVFTRKQVPFIKYLFQTYKSFISAMIMLIIVYFSIVSYYDSIVLEFNRLIGINWVSDTISIILIIFIGVIAYITMNILLRNETQKFIIYKIINLFKINKNQ